MTLPVVIPNEFANATASIPLSQLDSNFSTLANVVNQINAGTQQLSNANVVTLIVTGNATIGDASSDTVTLNSTLTANTAVIFSAGTSAAPAITTTGDTNTGIFFPAADTIAFAEGGVEAMRIDSSGNVSIGASSPRSTNALGTAQLSLEKATFTALQVFANPSTADGSYIGLWKARGGAVGGTTNVQNNDIFGAIYAGGWADGAFRTGGIIEFEVDGSTISSTSMPGRITFNTTASGATSATERMRITSGGDFLVGTTSNPGDYKIRASSSTSGAAISTSSTTATVLDLQPNSDGTGQVAILVYSLSAAAERLRIYSNGNIQNTNNSYGALSDIKLKENIVDATPKLDAIKKVRVVNFNVKGDSQKQIGVIAQELEQIFPGMVEESPDRSREGEDLGTTTKAVKYSVFVPMLIKAIQELSAKVDSLQAELNQLKGN
jgi:hypothetical protein